MSEMSWFRRALEIVRKQHPLSQSPKTFSFYMDDVDLLAFDEDTIDPYEWPSGHDAYLLTEDLFHAMQGAYPFIVRETFLQTMLSYPQERIMPTWSQRRVARTGKFGLGYRI
ncbi:hypothetical protein LTR67_011090 [Exophiala xenobiotica]